MRIADDYGYDPALGGFFKKAFKPLRRVKNKVTSTVVPKRARKFTSRAWKNPFFKAGMFAIATFGAGLALTPLVGAQAVATAGNIKKGYDLIKTANGFRKGLKEYKRAKRLKKNWRGQVERDAAGNPVYEDVIIDEQTGEPVNVNEQTGDVSSPFPVAALAIPAAVAAFYFLA